MAAAQRLPLIRAALKSTALRGSGWEQLIAETIIGERSGEPVAAGA